MKPEIKRDVCIRGQTKLKTKKLNNDFFFDGMLFVAIGTTDS